MRSNANRCLVALLLCVWSSSTNAQQATDLGLPTGGDYPQDDRQVWTFYRKEIATAAAAAAVKQEPDTAKTAALLFEAERFEEGLRVVEAVARRRVEQLPRALEALAAVAPRMRSHDARSYAESVRAIVQIARASLDRLPREVAARAARSLLHIEGQFPVTPPRDWKAAEADFAAEYAGTEAARLVEVDIAVRKMTETRKYGEPFDTGVIDAILKLHAGTTAAAKALYQKGVYVGLNDREPPRSDPTDRLMRLRAIVDELKSGRYPPSEWVDRAPSLILAVLCSRTSLRARQSGPGP